MIDIAGIIFLAVVVLGGVFGYRKGFFATITKPLKVVASLCLTVVVASPLINAWTRPLFIEKAEIWISNALMENTTVSGETLIEDLPVVFKLVIEIFNVNIETIESGGTTADLINLVAQELAAPVGNFIAVIVTYSALFILFLILLKILIAILDLAFTKKKGALVKINRILGLLLGAVVAVVINCALANIIGKIAPAAVDGVISQFFKNINPFSFILQL